MCDVYLPSWRVAFFYTGPICPEPGIEMFSPLPLMLKGGWACFAGVSNTV